MLHWHINAEGELDYAGTLRPADGQPVADLVCAGDTAWALQETRLLGWQLADGSSLPSVTLPAPAYLLAHRTGPQGVHLVTASETAWTCLQWCEDGWQVEAHWTFPSGTIESVDVAPDGQHVLGVIDGKRAIVFETKTGTEVERFAFPQDAHRWPRGAGMADGDELRALPGLGNGPQSRRWPEWTGCRRPSSKSGQGSSR